VFIEAKYYGSGGDNWSYKSCKATVKSSPPTNQQPVFLQAGCPSCRPTNSVKALKGNYHIPWTCLPKLTWGSSNFCLWPLIAPGYLRGGLPCLSSALWCQYLIMCGRCVWLLCRYCWQYSANWTFSSAVRQTTTRRRKTHQTSNTGYCVHLHPEKL